MLENWEYNDGEEVRKGGKDGGEAVQVFPDRNLSCTQDVIEFRTKFGDLPGTIFQTPENLMSQSEEGF